MAVPNHVLQVITKHISKPIYVIYKEDKNIKLATGVLANASPEKILVNIAGSTNKLEISHMSANNVRKILWMYNGKHINIFNPLKSDHLAKKLKIKDNMTIIINAMRPHVKKIITVIYQRNDKLHLLNGEFSNMGMNDLAIKPAPFFNNEDVIPYNSILHIYSEVGMDLIDV